MFSKKWPVLAGFEVSDSTGCVEGRNFDFKTAGFRPKVRFQISK